MQYWLDAFDNLESVGPGPNLQALDHGIDQAAEYGDMAE